MCAADAGICLQLKFNLINYDFIGLGGNKSVK